MSKYKLIIFDFDGTLADTYYAISFCIKKTFQKFNLNPPSEKDIRNTIGLSLEEVFKVLHAPVRKKEDILKWTAVYRDFYQREGELQTNLFPGTKELLSFAVYSGLNLVVISNKGIVAVNSALERFGIRGFIRLVIGDNSSVKGKSDPMLFYSIVQPVFADVRSNQTLVVGDTVTDMLFAENAGLDSCWASYGYGNRKECLALKPTFTIDNISELNSIIKASE